MKNLIEFNGIFFTEGTSEQVKQIISNHVGNRNERLRVYYGDATTGKSWHEENDICGYIGRSTGTRKIPLLIANNRSIGGDSILCDCIVKIVRISDKRVLYVHPTFNNGLFVVDGYRVTIDGLTHANCKSEQSAQRLADFMNGKRNSK